MSNRHTPEVKAADPVRLAMARELAATYCREVQADGWAAMYESGEWDNQPYVVIALRAMEANDGIR